MTSDLEPNSLNNCELTLNGGVFVQVMIGLLVMGIFFQFPTFYSSYSTMAFLSAVYGLCGGVFMSMLPLIVIDFVGLRHFPRAFGLAQLAFGFTLAPGYYLLGTFYAI